DLPLTGDWLMTNEVGDLRARVPSLLAQGHRVRLPEPLLEGVSSEIRSQNAMLRAETGTLGINQGATFPVFSTLYSSGSVSGLGGSYRFTPNFDVAGQAWQASEALTQTGTRSFTSYAGAARLGAVNGNRTSAGFLSSDSGAKGLWLDGEGRLAGWQHNVGAFRLDPNIDWVDRNSMVQSDIQGAYWRGATRSFRLNTSLGLDWSRNNVQDDPALNTRTARYGYTGLGYRFSPDMNLDTHLSLGDESVAGPAISTQDTTLTARGVVSNRFTSGTSTLTAATFDRSGSNDYRRSEVAWDYSWNAAGAIRGARSGVAYIRQSAVNLDTTEYQARGSLGWSGERLNLGSSVSVGYLTDPSFGNDTSANASLSLGWRLSHAWMMNGDLSYNHNTLTFGPTGDTRITSRQFRLSLRYDTRWGQPQIPFGAGTGKYGSGEIRGVLFYDKNGNGVRDPGEQGAANITVLLDNRYSAETNSNGEFSFVPVATGEHRLSVNVANIPLPWLVDERRPLIVNIRPRETGNLEIPLYSDRPN
ncbi:MAG: hypothetical protein OEV31_09510, partial [Gammaproteobacteria bacterium]|nr:hypothetical protein [Gammaproteobacteria bacterium]